MGGMSLERIPVEQLDSPEKNRFSRNRWLLTRRTCQLLILALFLAGPFLGLWVIKGNLASSEVLGVISLTDPLIMLQSLFAGHAIYVTAIIGAITVSLFYMVVGGRVYCSWVCPINLVTDLAAWLRPWLALSRDLAIPKQARYIVLFLVPFLCWQTGTIIWEFVNPITIVQRGLVYGVGLSWGVVLLVFLFDLFVTKRGWCGALCPVGAFYGLLGAKSLIRVNAGRRNRCTDCGDCYQVCPEPQVIVPALTGEKKGLSPLILSGECTNCGRCIDVCEENVFNFSHRFTNNRP